MPDQITLKDLFESQREKLALNWITGINSRQRRLLRGRQLQQQFIIGPLNYIHPNRIQVIGPTEQAYLQSLTTDELLSVLGRIFDANPYAIIVSNDLEPESQLKATAALTQTPLLTSPLDESHILDSLRYYLAKHLAERSTIHGVFLEVLGMGVLISGHPAVGKSELALELVTRGHRLIADDAPRFSRDTPDVISGSCPDVLRDFLEVRGLGILNIRAMFGDSAIKRNKFLSLIINLKRMKHTEIANMDRLKGSHTEREVLGIVIPQVTIPVAPGRNLAIMVETAVRNHILKLKGYEAAEVFIERQQALILKNTPK